MKHNPSSSDRAALDGVRTSVHHITNAKILIIKLGGEEKAFPSYTSTLGWLVPAAGWTQAELLRLGQKVWHAQRDAIFTSF